jgi:hypothetical protein
VSRLPKVGKFKTRAVLESQVLGMSFLGATVPVIAEYCEVSRSCIKYILRQNSSKLSQLSGHISLNNRKIKEA